MNLKHFLSAGVVAISLAAMSGPAAASTTVTFENYAGVATVIAPPTVSGGYSFVSGTANYTGPWDNNPYSDNGTEALIYGFGSMDMTKVGGGTFDVFKLDSGLTWYTSEESLVVTATGNVFGGGTVTDTFTIGRGYHTYLFSNLNDLTSLSFSGAPDGYVALDNIQVSVPEPASWAMMMFGVFGVGALMRRRKAALAA